MNLTRRGLLTGLVAFVAAPAIVRAGSLMPVKDFRYTRYLADYFVNSDEWTVRVDRSWEPLHLPKKWPRVITAEEAHRYIPKSIIDEILIPKPGEQLYLHTRLDWQQLTASGERPRWSL